MNLKHIYVIACYGISDVGKGWLTAGIGALEPEGCVAVKIDPLLNTRFPPHLGVEIGRLCSAADIAPFIADGHAADASHRVSEDMLTYRDAGLTIYPECNIVGGALFKSFLAQGEREVRPGQVKKLTLNDVSHHLCAKLADIALNRKARTLLIEVGGTIEDAESVYVPSAMRFLPEYLGVTPELVLLTYFEYAETPETYRVKTQGPRRGLAAISRVYYGLPLKACFVRRRAVPECEPDAVLLKDLEQVAYETQMDRKKLVLLPNIQSSERSRLTDVIRQTGLFDSRSQVPPNLIIGEEGRVHPTLISACLLGLTCQHDGQRARRELDPRIVNRLAGELIPVCPEQLGGLPTPREPVEISGGDGKDVLDGKARVLSPSGVEYTDQLVRGGHEVLAMAKRLGAARFVTQKRSPSCSCAGIYDGSFQHTLTAGGVGVCAALLERHAVISIDVDDFEKLCWLMRPSV